MNFWTLPLWPSFLCLLAGMLVGLVYFGGLWLTVKKMRTSPHFYRLMVFSWVMRTLFLLGAFYVLMQGDWQRLIVAFLGVLTVRYASSGFVKLSAKKEALNGKL